MAEFDGEEEYVPSPEDFKRMLDEDEEDALDEDDEDEEKEESTYFQWQLIGDNCYVPAGKITKMFKIPPGVYNIHFSRKLGYHLMKKRLALDELLIMPEPTHKKIIQDIRTFWDREKIFKKYKYTFKRGILLYGGPGNGKSSIINLLAKEIIAKHKGVVFFLNTPHDLEYFANFISGSFRTIEPNTRILCVLEDLETLTGDSSTETLLLNTLDGANQMNNIVYMGCTNYPERLKDRILNRPNRFDRRYEIKAPSPEVRKHYFEKKLKQDDLAAINVNEWVEKTEGLSIAHLGEIIKSVIILGNNIDDTLQELTDMKKKISSFDFDKDTDEHIGFTRKKY